LGLEERAVTIPPLAPGEERLAEVSLGSVGTAELRVPEAEVDANVTVLDALGHRAAGP